MRTMDVQKDIRVKRNEPTVYLIFERKGPRKPLYVDESSEGVWLRLHNNTHWKIVLDSFGVPKQLGEAGLFYEVERIRGEETTETPNGVAIRQSEIDEIPVGYRRGHTSSPLVLRPARSVLFSIPREHLAKDLAIRVGFHYEWEGVSGFIRLAEPQHSVYFYSRNLPENVR